MKRVCTIRRQYFTDVKISYIDKEDTNQSTKQNMKESHEYRKGNDILLLMHLSLAKSTLSQNVIVGKRTQSIKL